MRWLALVTWLVLGFFAMPLLVVIGASFTDANYVAFPPPGLGFKWFALALQKQEFANGMLLSLQLAFCASVLSTALATGAAWAMTQMGTRASRIGIGLFSFPLMIPGMLIGFSALQLWSSLGFPRNFAVLLVGHLVLTTPFAMRILFGAFSTFDRTLELAAYTLGTSQARTLWRVTLPAVRPAMLASLSLTFLLSFDDVVVAVFLSGPTLRTLPVVIFNHLDQNISPDLLAVSSLVIVISIAVILVVERSFGLGRTFGMRAGPGARQAA